MSDSQGSKSTLGARLSTIKSAVQSALTRQNLLLATVGLVAAHFALRTVFQVLYYVNLLTISVKTLTHDPDNSGGQSSKDLFDFFGKIYKNGHMSLRLAALIGSAASVIFGLVISPQSLLFLALNAPLVAFMLYDIARPIQTATTTATKGMSYTKGISQLLNHFRQLAWESMLALYNTWSYAAICAPLIHQTLASFTHQIAHFSVAASPIARLFIGTIQLSFLPHTLFLLSMAGGVAVVLQQKEKMIQFLSAKWQMFFSGGLSGNYVKYLTGYTETPILDDLYKQNSNLTAERQAERLRNTEEKNRSQEMQVAKIQGKVRELHAKGQSLEEIQSNFGTHLRQVITNTVDQLNAAEAGSNSGHALS